MGTPRIQSSWHMARKISCGKSNDEPWQRAGTQSWKGWHATTPLWADNFPGRPRAVSWHATLAACAHTRGHNMQHALPSKWAAAWHCTVWDRGATTRMQPGRARRMPLMDTLLRTDTWGRIWGGGATPLRPWHGRGGPQRQQSCVSAHQQRPPPWGATLWAETTLAVCPSVGAGAQPALQCLEDNGEALEVGAEVHWLQKIGSCGCSRL